MGEYNIVRGLKTIACQMHAGTTIGNKVAESISSQSKVQDALKPGLWAVLMAVGIIAGFAEYVQWDSKQMVADLAALDGVPAEELQAAIDQTRAGRTCEDRPRDRQAASDLQHPGRLPDSCAPEELDLLEPPPLAPGLVLAIDGGSKLSQVRSSSGAQSAGRLGAVLCHLPECRAAADKCRLLSRGRGCRRLNASR